MSNDNHLKRRNCGYDDLVYFKKSGEWYCQECGYTAEEGFEEKVRLQLGEKEYRALMARKTD